MNLLTMIFGEDKKKAQEPKLAPVEEVNMNVHSTILGSPNKSKSTMVVNDKNDRIDAWLQQKIEQGKRDPFAEIVTLTPSLARALLARNDANRKPSLLSLERLISDMEGGRWELNGESIVVADDGHLNDGQHRCMAVAECDRSIRTVIAFGIRRLSRYTVDTGVVRTVGHFLGMKGLTDSNNLGTVASYVWNYREYGSLNKSARGTSGRRRATKTELQQIIESYPDIAANLSLTKSSDPGSRSLNAFCRWAIARKAGDAATGVFFSKLNEGIGLSASSPILAARNRVINQKERLSPQERAELIFRSWNHHRLGTSGQLRTGSAVLPHIEA